LDTNSDGALDFEEFNEALTNSAFVAKVYTLSCGVFPPEPRTFLFLLPFVWCTLTLMLVLRAQVNTFMRSSV
jgi:hypothetical protein